MAQVTGLSTSEVSARRQHGEGNDARIETSRSYKDIIINNVFNPINVILFAIGAVMIAIGRIGDAGTGSVVRGDHHLAGRLRQHRVGKVAMQ